jgi:hypothetical protein
MSRQPLQKKPNVKVLADVGFNPTMHGTHHSARTRSTNHCVRHTVFDTGPAIPGEATLAIANVHHDACGVGVARRRACCTRQERSRVNSPCTADILCAVPRCHAHILTHCWVLQDSVSVALPGQLAESPEHIRVRVRVPPPHDLLQEVDVVQADHVPTAAADEAQR